MYKEQNKSFHYGIILIVNCSKICNAKVQYFSQSTKLQMFYRQLYQLLCFFDIYNSRNYKCFIDRNILHQWLIIYNSRNYKCFIDLTITFAAALYLQ